MHLTLQMIKLEKVEMHVVQDINLQRFDSYPSLRKRYTSKNQKRTSYRNITCGIPPGSN